MLSHFYLYGELRSSGVMGRRNGPSGIRDDDEDVLRSFQQPLDTFLFQRCFSCQHSYSGIHRDVVT